MSKFTNSFKIWQLKNETFYSSLSVGGTSSIYWNDLYATETCELYIRCQNTWNVMKDVKKLSLREFYTKGIL